MSPVTWVFFNLKGPRSQPPCKPWFEYWQTQMYTATLTRDNHEMEILYDILINTCAFWKVAIYLLEIDARCFYSRYLTQGQVSDHTLTPSKQQLKGTNNAISSMGRCRTLVSWVSVLCFQQDGVFAVGGVMYLPEFLANYLESPKLKCVF